MVDVKVGETVVCPKRQRKKGYTGTITWVGESKGRDSLGNEFVWVSVRDQNGKEEAWPSNRLGKEPAQ